MLQEGYIDKVYYRYAKAENETALVFAIHGLGGHSFWFDKAALLFNEKKISFFSFDLPGFGRSKYQSGYISSYKFWLSTAEEIFNTVVRDFNKSKVPVFIVGHSMGALISILLKNINVNGMVLSVPGFEGHPETWDAKSILIPVLCKAFLKPDENVILPFGPELLTKNKNTQLEIKKDPYRVINPSAHMFKEVYFLTLQAKRMIKKINLPVLMLISGNDKVCSNVAMEKYFNLIPSSDKCMKVYTNALHDLFIEEQVIDVVSDISTWISVHK